MSEKKPPSLARVRFAEKLKSLRIAQNFTQVEFAKIIGLEQAELSRLEKGDRGFTSDSLTAIAAALGLEPWELLSPIDKIETGRGQRKARRKEATSPESLSIPDAAAILSRLANASPLKRQVVLAILFDNPALVRKDGPDLAQLVQSLSKALR